MSKVQTQNVFTGLRKKKMTRSTEDDSKNNSYLVAPFKPNQYFNAVFGRFSDLQHIV